MKNITIVITVVIPIICCTVLLFLKEKNKRTNRNVKKKGAIVVSVPEVGFWIGFVGTLVFVVLMILQLSVRNLKEIVSKRVFLLVILCFGLFHLAAFVLMLKSFYIITLSNETITVFTVLMAPRIMYKTDIVDMRTQTKKTYYGEAKRMIIYFSNHKRIKIESIMTNYEIFKKEIEIDR